MRIFVRILISFWVAMLIVIALVTFVPLLSSTLADEGLRDVPLAALQVCAQTALSEYRKGGAKALRHQSANCYNGRLVNPATETVSDLSGRILPPYEIHSIRRAKEVSEVLVQALPDVTLVVMRAEPKPDSFIYLTLVPLPTHSIWHIPRAVPLSFFSGVFAFLAAAPFVRSIARLSHVAERFGAGDLKVRAGQSLSKRKDEIGDLARILNQMAARIELLVDRYKSFLAHASHELGSPLTRLNIALALAKRKAGSQLEPELDRIEQEAIRLNSLVQEMLLLARLESGNELSRSAVLFGIDAVIQGACEDAMFEAQQVRKRVVIVEGQGFQVRGYPDLLRRALDNVLRNGLRFTRKEGPVEVSYFKRVNSTVGVILIKDEGPGIPPGAEEAIFEPFTRLPGDGEEASAGSGLGLAIARQAVIANGGKIFVQPPSGQGLTVGIEIPIAMGGSDG